MNISALLPADVSSTVRRALSEDIGTGDLTAELISADSNSDASVICRDNAILCGIAWFNEVFKQLDKSVQIDWAYEDGAEIEADGVVCNLHGPTRTLLTGERTALNFLQLLSATATTTRDYVALIGDSSTQLLDTRKTIPGLRTAQKYAVACGGGQNHRMGLYDAILIKENHIKAAGGIELAIKQVTSLHRNVQVEVENLDELQQALRAGADKILLDNFTIEMIQEAVNINNGQTGLEVSGGIDADNIRAFTTTGVDYISVGNLTKNIHCIDFSMRILG